MNTHKFIFLASATVLCLTFNSCEENLPPLPEGVNPNVEATADAAEENRYTDVQPTTVIDPQNNVYGYITDKTTGKGISNVPVTDGYHYTKTDQNGCYQFVADSRTRNIYYSTPADYKIEVNSNKSPAFFSTTPLNFSQQNRIDFTLEKLDKDETNWTYVPLADPQCQDSYDCNRLRNEFLPDIKSTFNNGSWENIYGMTLGDINFDNQSQWGTMIGLMSNVTINKDYGYLPIFNCIGNHDHNSNLATTSDYAAEGNYVSYFGPRDYSFNRGKAHVVVMDDYIATDDAGGYCSGHKGFTEDQLQWLKEDLACVPNKEEMLLIFGTHCPMSTSAPYMSNVLSEMSNFYEVHIMEGDWHIPWYGVFNSYITRSGKPIYEHVHGAVCGAWWFSNMCVDGTPSGYAIYEVTGNTIRNYYSKATGMNVNDSQMCIYNGNETYSDFPWDWGTTSWTQNDYTYSGNNLKGKVIANIFYGENEDWEVKLIWNGTTYPMTLVPKAQRDWNRYSFLVNGAHRGINNGNYMDERKRFWVVNAPNGNPATLTNWQVVATHTIPESGIQNVYTTSTMQNGYQGYVYHSNGSLTWY